MGGARSRLAATLAALAAVSLAITPVSCAPPRSRLARAGTPRVYLPAADAADLASGAADHVVRAAFLLPGAPGAMLVRGVPGYADARLAALASLAACADSDAAADAARWRSGTARHGASNRFSRRTVAAAGGGRLPPRSTPRAANDLARVSRRSAPPRTPPPPPPLPPSTDSSDTTRADSSPAPQSSPESLDHFHAYVDRGAALAEPPNGATPTPRSKRSSTDDVPNDVPKTTSSHGKGKRGTPRGDIPMTPALTVPRGAAAAEAAAAERARGQHDARGFDSADARPSSPPTLSSSCSAKPRARIFPAGLARDARVRRWRPYCARHVAPGLRRGRGGGVGIGSSRAWFGRMETLPARTSRAPHGAEPRASGARATRARSRSATEGGGLARRGVPRADPSSETATSEAASLEDDASCGAGQGVLLVLVHGRAASVRGGRAIRASAGAGLAWPAHRRAFARPAARSHAASRDGDADAARRGWFPSLVVVWRR